METNLRGRVRNSDLKPRHCLVPLYEAVMNSLQAIEDRAALSGKNVALGVIQISISRREAPKELFQSGNLPAVLGVEVSDNGIGFDDRHLARRHFPQCLKIDTLPFR